MVALLKTPSHTTAEEYGGPYPTFDTPLGAIGRAPAKTGAERRMFPRKELSASVEGQRMDNTLPALQHPQLTLALRDLSFGGLSAISSTPLASGERLSVFFPENGPLSGWDAYGRVIRCEASGLGYRIAVEFDPLPAA